MSLDRAHLSAWCCLACTGSTSLEKPYGHFGPTTHLVACKRLSSRKDRLDPGSGCTQHSHRVLPFPSVIES